MKFFLRFFLLVCAMGILFSIFGLAAVWGTLKNRPGDVMWLMEMGFFFASGWVWTNNWVKAWRVLRGWDNENYV